MSASPEQERLLRALEFEEKQALEKLDFEYQQKREALLEAYAQKRLDSATSSPDSVVNPSEGANEPSVPPPPAPTAPEPPPPAAPAPAPAAPPEPEVPAPAQAEELQTSSNKMTLWEWEQKEKTGLDDDRAARIAALDTQRKQEAAEAQQRQEEWRAADEARLAAEEVARLKLEVDAKAAQQAAVERGRAEVEQHEREMVAEQERLAAEKERVRVAAVAKAEALKRQSSDGEDFAYVLEAGMEAKIKAFRQRGQGGDALIIRIDHNANELKIEEQFKGLASCEVFAEKLDETEPRYLLYIHKVAYADGRVQYPIAFMVFLPETMPTHLKVMYTRPVVTLTDTFKVPKHIMLDDPEDLTAEWLEERLGVSK